MMNRRTLLINSSKAALIALSCPLISCRLSNNKQNLQLEEAGIQQISDDLRNGNYNITDLVKYYLN